MLSISGVCHDYQNYPMEATIMHFVLKDRDWLDDFVNFSSLDSISFG